MSSLSAHGMAIITEDVLIICSCKLQIICTCISEDVLIICKLMMSSLSAHASYVIGHHNHLWPTAYGNNICFCFAAYGHNICLWQQWHLVLQYMTTTFVYGSSTLSCWFLGSMLPAIYTCTLKLPSLSDEDVLIICTFASKLLATTFVYGRITLSCWFLGSMLPAIYTCQLQMSLLSAEDVLIICWRCPHYLHICLKVINVFLTLWLAICYLMALQFFSIVCE